MMLDSAAVAERINVKVDTIHWYHKKGMMPPADEYFGRSPAWRTETIDDWIAKRHSRKISTPEPEDAT